MTAEPTICAPAVADPTRADPTTDDPAAQGPATPDAGAQGTALSPPTAGGRLLRNAACVAVALTSAAVLVLTGIGWAAQEHLDLVVSDALTGAPVGGGEAFTALLVGLDARTDTAGNPLPPALLDALQAGPDEGQLATDTIILLHVPAAASSAPAVAISIPRDSYVPIAGGRGKHKINLRTGEASRTPRRCSGNAACGVPSWTVAGAREAVACSSPPWRHWSECGSTTSPRSTSPGSSSSPTRSAGCRCALTRR